MSDTLEKKGRGRPKGTFKKFEGSDELELEQQPDHDQPTAPGQPVRVTAPAVIAVVERPPEPDEGEAVHKPEPAQASAIKIRKQAAPTISVSTGTSTQFDAEIESLKQQRDTLEEEVHQLKDGKISLKIGDSTIQLSLNGAADKKILQELAENPVVETIADGYKKKNQLIQDLTFTGDVPEQSGSTVENLILTNQRIDRTLAEKFPAVARLAKSPALIIGGIIILIFLIGVPLLSPHQQAAPGRNVDQPERSATPAPTRNITQTGSSSTGAKARPAAGQQQPPIVYLNSQAGGADNNDQTTEGDEQEQERVGKPPSIAGGLNGPHGSFFAPSQLSAPALQLLNKPIQRALTVESASQVNILWPKSGVAHYGVYPGEIGNLILMATQKELPTIRELQLNDEIYLYDRKGARATYRIINLSVSGQSERLINLDTDAAWLLQPTNQYAVLTLLVTTANRAQTGSEVTITDSFTDTKRLAYRAVLAEYLPAGGKSSTPVEVPDDVWKLTPPQPQPTTQPNASLPNIAQPQPLLAGQPKVKIKFSVEGGGDTSHQPPPTQLQKGGGTDKG